MIGATYSQSTSLEPLDFYSINTPENINTESYLYRYTVFFDVNAYNFSELSNLSYEWSTDFNGSPNTVEIVSPNEKETVVRFYRTSGDSISGNLYCKVTDSGLPNETTSTTNFKIDFQ